MLRDPEGWIDTLDEPFKTAIHKLQELTDDENLDAKITEGWRSWTDQRRLYAKGRTPEEVAQRVRKQGKDGSVTDARAGESAHNYGLAIDIEGTDREKIKDIAHLLGLQTVSWDPNHIELKNWRQYADGYHTYETE